MQKELNLILKRPWNKLELQHFISKNDLKKEELENLVKTSAFAQAISYEDYEFKKETKVKKVVKKDGK